MTEFNLSDKIKTKHEFNYAHQGFHSDPELLEVTDVKEFIRLLKDRKCMFSDSVVYCKTCKKEKHLVMRDASMCFDCYIDYLAGDKFK
jgi:hypothetical protein